MEMNFIFNERTDKLDVVEFDDVRICYRNFEGRASQYNREGDRNFSLVIEDQEVADALIEQGFNVKIKAPREEGDTPFMHLPIKINFNNRGPHVYLVSNGRSNRLTERTVGVLDNVDIKRIRLDIAPHEWEVNGKTGTSAYLRAIEVTQEVNRFEPVDTRMFDDEEEIF